LTCIADPFTAGFIAAIGTILSTIGFFNLMWHLADMLP
jgi:hypothetical protein